MAPNVIQEVRERSGPSGAVAERACGVLPTGFLAGRVSRGRATIPMVMTPMVTAPIAAVGGPIDDHAEFTWPS